MNRLLPITFALALGLGVPAWAAGGAAQQIPEGTPVTLVAVIHNTPRTIRGSGDHSMRVLMGPTRTRYTVIMRRAHTAGPDGQPIAANALRQRMWILADGFATRDPHQIEARRVQVISIGTPTVPATAAGYRPGLEQGYVVVTTTAFTPGAAAMGAQTPVTRAMFGEGTPVAILGRISSEPSGVVGEEKMQVAVGPERTDFTVHFSNARLMGPSGQAVQASDLDEDHWIYAVGRVMDDPRRIMATQVQLFGTEAASVRPAGYLRPGFESGYVVATGPVCPPGIPASQAGMPTATPTSFAEGTPVVVVGEISSEPRDVLGESRTQVAVGPARLDYTLHTRGAPLFGPTGREIQENDLDTGQWVRAEGFVMDDPRRIRVSRLHVIGKDMQSLRQSAFYQPGLDQGYVMSVAGARQTLPPGHPAARQDELTIVGRVVDDTSRFARKIQVNAGGTEWTLHVPRTATVTDETGRTLSVHDVAPRQWIRATGSRIENNQRIMVTRLDRIGSDQAFLGSPYYAASAPLGYVQTTAGQRAAFGPGQFRGTIVAVHEQEGRLVVRDSSGTDHHVQAGGATIYYQGRTTGLGDLRVGDVVTVHAR